MTESFFCGVNNNNISDASSENPYNEIYFFRTNKALNACQKNLNFKGFS